MPKLLKTSLCDKKRYKICCNICGNKYDGERGMKLHFKYSHGTHLSKEYMKKHDVHGEIFYKCLICSKNALTCHCPTSKQIT